jgi:protein phosphatase
MLVDSGAITEEEAMFHPERHYITRVVGIHPTVSGDSDECPLQPGDTLLLCSDGLYGSLSERKLAELTQQAAEQKDCAPLIDAANRSGGYDNITAVLMIYGKGE